MQLIFLPSLGHALPIVPTVLHFWIPNYVRPLLPRYCSWVIIFIASAIAVEPSRRSRASALVKSPSLIGPTQDIRRKEVRKEHAAKRGSYSPVGSDCRFVRLGGEKLGNAGRKDMVVLRMSLTFFSDAYSLNYCLSDRYGPATHSVESSRDATSHFL